MSAPETPSGGDRPVTEYSQVYTVEVLQAAAAQLRAGVGTAFAPGWLRLSKEQRRAVRNVVAALTEADLLLAVRATAERLIERESGDQP